MPPVLLLLGAAGLAGAGYAYWTKSKASPSSPTVTPASTPIGPGTGPSVKPKTEPTTPTGTSIVTPGTTSAPPQTLPLVETPTQKPMPSDSALKTARVLALDLEKRLMANTYGPNYATKDKALFALVKQFQTLMNIAVDGLYGPETAGALLYMTGNPPPPPYGKDRNIKVYRPMPGSGKSTSVQSQSMQTPIDDPSLHLSMPGDDY